MKTLTEIWKFLLIFSDFWRLKTSKINQFSDFQILISLFWRNSARRKTKKQKKKSCHLPTYLPTYKSLCPPLSLVLLSVTRKMPSSNLCLGCFDPWTSALLREADSAGARERERGWRGWGAGVCGRGQAVRWSWWAPRPWRCRRGERSASRGGPAADRHAPVSLRSQ